MKAISKKSTNRKASLVLSLQRDLHSRNYYLLYKNQSEKVIMMEESSSTEISDHFTLFRTWEDALKDMNKFEGSIVPEKRWWSYCPGWMYFNPAFIHQGLKQVFSTLISRSLEDLQESDVVKEEKERFNVWNSVCNSQECIN